MKQHGISISFSKDEYEWLKHAARLRHLSVNEYVRRAINAELVREGVDAVLLREKGDR